ncbi:ABC transporter permease [Kitasatospora sp. NPDC058478]|uniref:ABC transporter permease n=1 Tax=unclassified Kitasatospora TaxID=2633591 RepID=UPI003659F285
MMRIFLLELRRSPLKWWLPFLITLDLAVLFGRSQWWIGVWPEASVAAQIPSFYLGPLLAAAAAWSAGRVQRHGLQDQITAASRSRWKAELVQLAATVSYGIVAYIAGILSAALVSYRDAGPGFLWPGYLLLGTSVLVLCIALGHAVGRWFPSVFASPVVCGLGCFVVLAATAGPSGLGLFLLSGPPASTTSAGAVAVRLLIACLAVSLVVLVDRPVKAERKRIEGAWPERVTALGCAVAVVALGAVYGPMGPVQVRRSAPEASLCTASQPKICVWPEQRKYLPQLEAMATRAAQLPRGLIISPPVFYERGLKNSTVEESFTIREGSMWEVAISMSILIVNASTPSCVAKTSDDQGKILTADFELDSWVAARITGSGQPSDVHGGPPGVDQEAIGRLIMQSETAQNNWAQERIQSIKGIHCA